MGEGVVGLTVDTSSVSVHGLFLQVAYEAMADSWVDQVRDEHGVLQSYHGQQST